MLVERIAFRDLAEFWDKFTNIVYPQPPQLISILELALRNRKTDIDQISIP